MEIHDQIEIQDKGYGILRGHFAASQMNACRDAFWPRLSAYLETDGESPNRGPHRHFLPMSFEPRSFIQDFFFDNEVLRILRAGA